MEAVLPIEIEEPSLRVFAECLIAEADWQQSWFEELMLFDERRLKTLYHVQGYQRRIAQAFNKKVKSRNLKEGDLVLKDNRAPSTTQGASSDPIGLVPTSAKLSGQVELWF